MPIFGQSYICVDVAKYLYKFYFVFHNTLAMFWPLVQGTSKSVENKRTLGNHCGMIRSNRAYLKKYTCMTEYGLQLTGPFYA